MEIKISPLEPLMVVAVKATLSALEVNQTTSIPYSDAKPSTILTTASRIKGKSFGVTTKGSATSTIIKRTC